MKRIATVVALGLLLAGCAYYGPGYGYGPGYYSNYGWSSYPGANSGERTASPAATYSG